MPNTKYVNYMQSIASQLEALKDRFRLLIGHWPTDGSYKEILLRNIISKSVPKKIGVCQGFMANENGQASTQIDIMLTDELNKPTLFREGDLVVVTPDCVLAIIEVKTRIRSKSELVRCLKKIAENKEKHFETTHQLCEAGLFCYEDIDVSDADILEVLHLMSCGKESRAINFLSFGTDRFFRFWYAGESSRLRAESGWHSYKLDRLAQAYFISNLIWNLSELGTHPFEYSPEKIWFPIHGGKESQITGYIGLKTPGAKMLS